MEKNKKTHRKESLETHRKSMKRIPIFLRKRFYFRNGVETMWMKTSNLHKFAGKDWLWGGEFLASTKQSKLMAERSEFTEHSTRRDV